MQKDKNTQQNKKTKRNTKHAKMMQGTIYCKAKKENIKREISDNNPKSKTVKSQQQKMALT